MPLIDDVLSSADLRPFFQPIVSLDALARPIGFESVARFRTDSPLRNPEILFKYAMRKQRTADLEFVCIAQTIETAQLLPGTPAIFLNVHPDVFRHGVKLPETLRGLAAKHGVALHRLVVEITEQAALPDSRDVFRAIDGLRELGVRLAYDDVGVAYSHLPVIGKVRPSFLKISQAFGSGFEGDETKTKIVKNILALASDFGSEVILEGIEEPSTARAARELGIPLGQGFLFGRPADASTFGVDLPLAACV
jgi:EAL domain-containing protein (putative c-di-GMP-specific phosphodiesterase class I)